MEVRDAERAEPLAKRARAIANDDDLALAIQVLTEFVAAVTES